MVTTDARLLPRPPFALEDGLECSALALSPDGGVLWVGTGGGQLVLMDMQKGSSRKVQLPVPEGMSTLPHIDFISTNAAGDLFGIAASG